MERLFLGLVWIAALRAISATQLCQPVLAVKSKDPATVSLKWSCRNESMAELKAFELHFTSQDREEPRILSLAKISREYTFKAMRDRPPFQFFIKAIHQDEGVTDQSELIEVSLPRCDPVLSLQQNTLSDITVKWECKNTIPKEVRAFKLTYVTKTYPPRRAEELTTESTHQEHTLSNLTCGATYVLFVDAFYGSRTRILDRSNLFEVKLGGTQNYPKGEDLLEVDDTCVTVKLDQFTPICPVKTFKMSLKGNGVSEENRTEASEKQFTFHGLRPNTEYKLVIQPDYPLSEAPEYTFRTLCEKTKVPVAPPENEVLDRRHKYFVVHLDKWNCVDSFAVEYRLRNNKTWNLVSNNIKPEQKSFIIQRMMLGSRYYIRINATNRAGTTVADRWMEQDGNVCGDWLLYGEKCVKNMKEAGLLPKNEAQAVCERFKEDLETPSLYIVRHESHQVGLASLDVPGPVWLGMSSDDGETFYWDDGSEVGFSSWDNQSLQNKESRCVKMVVDYRNDYPDDSRPWHYNHGNQRLGGRHQIIRWVKVSCSSRNYVVCEKPQPKPLMEYVEAIGKRQTESENKIEALEKKLNLLNVQGS